MSFLAPLFLFGALAVVGPVLFHLVRRTTREKVRFSSLMFLRPTPPRVSRRSRLEHWLLLLLRALVLALLAVAFARPFLKSLADEKPFVTAERRLVVLLDASASMSREGLWPQAQEKARRAVEDAGATAEVAVVAFDRSAAPLVSFDEWRATPVEARLELARTRVEAARPSSGSTGLASALTMAAEWLAEAQQGGAREIVVVSDLQEGSRLEGLQGYQWPNGLRVTLSAVVPEKKGNAGVHLVAPTLAEAAAGEEGVRVRVQNAPDSTEEALQVGWDGGAAVDVHVPPGQSRSVVVPWPAGGAKAGLLRLRGDAADFDDTLAVVPPPVVSAVVLHGGPEVAAEPRGPLFFLERAVPQGGRVTVKIEPLMEKPAEAALTVVTGSLPPAIARQAHDALVRGGTALVVVRDAAMAETLGTLLGVTAPTLSEQKPASGYAMLGRIDFGHPLFAPFADPRFSDFTKTRFWRHRTLEAAAFPHAHVVAAFDDGEPAILDVPVEKGRALVLTSGWHPDDSQFALSSKFPSLIARVLDLTGRVTPPVSQVLVGDPPTGETKRPGLVTTANGPLAVNLDPAESRTAPLPPEELEKLGVPLTNPAAKTPMPVDPAAQSLAGAVEAEARQKLWRWLVLAACALLLAETLLARWLSTREARTAESA